MGSTAVEELPRTTNLVSRTVFQTFGSDALFNRWSSWRKALRAMLVRETPTLVRGNGKKNLDWMLSKPTMA